MMKMKYMYRTKIINILLEAKKDGITEGKLLQLLGTSKKTENVYLAYLRLL